MSDALLNRIVSAFYGAEKDDISQADAEGWLRVRAKLSQESAEGPAEASRALAEGELWSWTRSVMSQGACIYQDYAAGTHKGYEAYSAHMDAAASKRADELSARLATPQVTEAPSPAAPPAHTEGVRADLSLLEGALQFAGNRGMAVTKEWVRGWEDCLTYARAALAQTDPPPGPSVHQITPFSPPSSGGSPDSLGMKREPLCMCKDRPLSKCPGEWEPGCDLGANDKFARGGRA